MSLNQENTINIYQDFGQSLSETKDKLHRKSDSGFVKKQRKAEKLKINEVNETDVSFGKIFIIMFLIFGGMGFFLFAIYTVYGDQIQQMAILLSNKREEIINSSEIGKYGMHIFESLIGLIVGQKLFKIMLNK